MSLEKRIAFLTSLLAFAFMLFACAGQKKSDPVEGKEMTPADHALMASEFLIMDSLSQIGVMLANQDGLAWVASDSLNVDLPEPQWNELKGWVAQGSLTNGFCLFYGRSDSGFVQLARYDFVNGVMSRAVGNIEIPEGKILDLVRMNDSASTFFRNSKEKEEIRYNSYILEKDGEFTFYVMPASTNEYVVYGGSMKLTMSNGSWVIEKLHKGPIGLKWESVQNGDSVDRTSTMGPLLNEADFAQYYITRQMLPRQYIRTTKYTILLTTEKDGKMSIIVAR